MRFVYLLRLQFSHLDTDETIKPLPLNALFIH
nr:MAG TPA: hypothetical protein [Caudoviricetes sp.]